MTQPEIAAADLAIASPPAWRAVAGRSLVPAIASLGLVMIVSLLASVLLRSFGSLESATGRAAIIALFSDAEYYRTLLDTFYFALLTTVVAMLFGVPIAWFVERTDLPGREAIRVMMGAGILIPGFFTAMGWVYLAHPRIGMLNIWLKDAGIVINIQTLTGMGFVQGLALAALAFVVAAPSLSAIDSTLEESAEIHGLSLVNRFRYVTLPLVTPALMASALVTFMVALAVFDIPAVLGLSAKILLYSTYVYNLVNPASAEPLYEIAAASSAPMLLLAVGLSVLYYRIIRQSSRYQVVSGKGYRSKLTPLGARGRVGGLTFVGLYLFLVLLLPLLLVAWGSFLPFFRPISVDALRFLSFNNYVGVLTPSLWTAVGHTLIFSVVAPTFTTIISVALSWVILRQSRAISRAVELIAFLPLSIPSVIFGVGAITIALAIGSFVPIYGSLALIILVEIVVRTSVATRITGSAMVQIHRELDEAGAVFGLSTGVRFTRILLPLLGPALAYCWLFLAVLAFRELTVPALLVSRDNLTVSVYTWGLLSLGSLGRASAVTILVLLSVALLGAATLVVGRLAVRVRAEGRS
ncbi:MAG TPA: ABC transporter permease subunit [Stellaceae bacterium]|nr:ABC transporter permease subunit [Stellaceae bacterium]